MPFELTEQIRRHLADDPIVHLTTVTPHGRPAPRPVWFVWDGTHVLVYSQPNVAKLRHIAANPHVTVSTNTGPDGEDVVVISGEAALSPDAPAASQVPAYVERYAAGMRQQGMTPTQFAASYSVPILITPIRAWAIQ